MENPDEISGGALDRIDTLERIINKFKIAVAGDGDVQGKFGSLPKNQSQLSPHERLANLESVTNQFGLSGQNVDVAGTFDDGFTLS